VNNTPLEQLELASWQHRHGVVSQDPFLFNATITAKHHPWHTWVYA
jgi:ABC-type multidrug transport system fused ATPase/permease subunit